MDKVEMLANLVVMAAADRTFSQQEVAHLTRRAGQLGILAEEFDAAITRALEPGASLVVPPSQQDRVILLSELIQMMSADGQVADAEKELLAVAGARLGLSSDELNDLIDTVV